GTAARRARLSASGRRRATATTPPLGARGTRRSSPAYAPASPTETSPSTSASPTGASDRWPEPPGCAGINSAVTLVSRRARGSGVADAWPGGLRARPGLETAPSTAQSGVADPERETSEGAHEHQDRSNTDRRRCWVGEAQDIQGDHARTGYCPRDESGCAHQTDPTQGVGDVHVVERIKFSRAGAAVDHTGESKGRAAWDVDSVELPAGRAIAGPSLHLLRRLIVAGPAKELPLQRAHAGAARDDEATAT